VVTAACGTSSVPEAPVAGNAAAMSPNPDTHVDIPRSQPVTSAWLDFKHLKSQLPIQRVLEHLNLFASLRGRGSQWRGPCPVHGHGHGRTFSVHLGENVFQCFDPKCAIKGDIIDLWAVVKGLKPRAAALELVTLFNLEPAPVTEKRHG
jgi:hypothetical protein